ncbi:MAG: DUF732 domain-containing protein [Mycobacterium sp.]
MTEGSAPMRCPYCGSDIGNSGTCERCGALHGSVALTGWRPDPTARHEGRYYIAGRPTSRVRNGRAETTDPDGGQMLPEYVDLPSSGRTSIKSTWLGTGAATAVIFMLAAMVWVLLLPRHKSASPDAGYLSALKYSGLSDQFNSDASALAYGREVCRQLDNGGPQQGLAADKIAVDAFCPEFSEGFHILETATLSGTFVLIDTKSNTDISSIASDGTSCEGTYGYSDIGRDTQVTLKNGKGEILATTVLGEGRSGDVNCTFSFSFPVTEGEDRYVVSVGRRGDFSYTFNQLQRQGIEIRLGH